MPSRSHVYRFGPYVLDARRLRLSEGGEDIELREAFVRVLLCLVANAGQIISRHELANAGWGNTAISLNNVDQALSALRAVLGDGYIETFNRRGCRFRADPVIVDDPPADDDAEVLAPFHILAEANALIDTLAGEQVARACDLARSVVIADPANAAAHGALAMARALIYEASREDLLPDHAALRDALEHAETARRRAPASGEAWSTYAFVLHLTGRVPDSIAAARKAIELEPGDWRHYLRLAYVSWGEARLRAAYHVMELCPGLALSHWLAATVFIARGAFKQAILELRKGCAMQDAQCRETGRFNAVGLHLLLGLVLAALGSYEEALEELARELTLEVPGQIYARECCANTWYSRGAILLRLGRIEEAIAAFREALLRVPGHALAEVAVAAALRQAAPPIAGTGVTTISGLIATAAAFVHHDRRADAVRLVTDMLTSAEPGFAGWLLPAEPSFNMAANAEIWAPVLALLQTRAI